MSDMPPNAPPPLPGRSAASIQPAKKRGVFSTLVSLLAAGFTVFAIYTAVFPFFCRDCFYVETVSMNDVFAKLGQDRDDIRSAVVAADKAIDARKYRDRAFDFDSAGHVNSTNSRKPHGRSVGDVVFGDPNEIVHGTLERLHFFDYKIPVLDISLQTLSDIIEALTGWQREKVSIQLSCTGNCEPPTWRGRMRFGESGEVIEALGSEMLKHITQGSYRMFAHRADVATNNIDPIDFFAFMAFESKDSLILVRGICCY